MIDTTILHYRILERLGQGGMGEVFLSEDLRLHRPVALKLLRQRAGCEEEERARILREARAASALNHPNIAVIYDVNEAETPEGRVYLLAMEYVPGKTLSELAAASTLSLDDILDLIGQAADALTEAHARGVVHRDIKPSNLMVTQGRIKVLDFGLAQIQPQLPADSPTWTRDAAARAAGTVRRHTALHVPGAGARSSARCPLRHLLPGCRLLRAPGRTAPVPRRHRRGKWPTRSCTAIRHRFRPASPIRGCRRSSASSTRMLAKDAAARPRGMREIRSELTRLRSRSSFAAAPATNALTVAVAGFANLTRKGEDEWLGTGLSETVTAGLQEIEGLEVWGRERLRESLRLLGVEATELKPEDAAELGAMTGARWVLAGAFQRLDDQVRVTGAPGRGRIGPRAAGGQDRRPPRGDLRITG